MFAYVGFFLYLCGVNRRKQNNHMPSVYDGALAEFRDICNYWGVENIGHVSAKIDEQKTEATKQKIVDLVAKL